MTKESPLNDFGSYVAYLIPGATVLLGASPLSPTVRAWFATAPTDSPTIGGFLYLTLASLAAGMTVSAIRWVVVDTVHGWTGLRPPSQNFSRLGNKVEAFSLLIEIHYRHYLFYANMFVATAIAYSLFRGTSGFDLYPIVLDAGFVVLEMIFFTTSRDTLRKYYVRTRQLLS